MVAKELYGIEHTAVKTVLTKNIFTTYMPVSVAIYMDDKGLKIPYIYVHSGKLAIKEVPFSALLGIKKQDLSKVTWENEFRNPHHTKSIRPPGIDMAALIDNQPKAIFEVKLTVVPTHAERKVTEMIVRQNTQFSFIERLCYAFGEKLDSSPSIVKLNKIILTQENNQHPFILHALWKTKGHTHMIDENHAFDVSMISDLAYLKILLSAPLQKGTAKTRIGRVIEHFLTWITEFKTKGKLTYKDIHQGSRDHLKITLYMTDYLPALAKLYYNLRLKMEDLQKIILPTSIKKLAPERRLDSSIIFTLSNIEAEKSNN